MKNLQKDIKNKDFKSIYLLCGKEEYLKNSFKNLLKKAIIKDEINFSYFSGKELDIDKLRELSRTLPFFDSRRCIIVEESGYFKNSSDKKIQELVENIPKSTILIFVEKDVDKKNKIYKLVKEKGYVCELDKPSENDLINWCLNIITKEGRKINKQAMELLISYAGKNMENLKNELDKLLAYTMDKEIIDSSDIMDIVSEDLETKIFEMIRYISIKQTDKALSLYKALLINKEPERKIFSIISRQFLQLLEVKSLSLEACDKNDIMKVLKISAYASTQMLGRVRSFDKNMLKNYVISCLELEKAINMGEISERIALELLITA